jgi:hypothetical protein
VMASDAVPREAVVVPELVTFLPLSAGPGAWAGELSEILSLPRYETGAAAEMVKRSDYSIDKSYESLHAIYSSVPA